MIKGVAAQPAEILLGNVRLSKRSEYRLTPRQLAKIVGHYCHPAYGLFIHQTTHPTPYLMKRCDNTINVLA